MLFHVPCGLVAVVGEACRALPVESLLPPRTDVPVQGVRSVGGWLTCSLQPGLMTLSPCTPMGELQCLAPGPLYFHNKTVRQADGQVTRDLCSLGEGPGICLRWWKAERREGRVWGEAFSETPFS